jgi:hypothetical protein
MLAANKPSTIVVVRVIFPFRLPFSGLWGKYRKRRAKAGEPEN